MINKAIPGQKEKHFLQKTSAFFSMFCLVSAVICVLVLVVYYDDFTKVYVASLAASTFFFFSVAIVLKVIAGTDLPTTRANGIDE